MTGPPQVLRWGSFCGVTFEIKPSTDNSCESLLKQNPAGCCTHSMARRPLILPTVPLAGTNCASKPPPLPPTPPPAPAPCTDPLNTNTQTPPTGLLNCSLSTIEITKLHFYSFAPFEFTSCIGDLCSIACFSGIPHSLSQQGIRYGTLDGLVVLKDENI